MTQECWTACPQCGEYIEFYTVVDIEGRCPECGTPADTLFEIAIDIPGSSGIEAVTDGGRVDE